MDYGDLSPVRQRAQLERLMEQYTKLESTLHTVTRLLADRIEGLERTNAALLDRVNQLVEFHGVAPVGGAPLERDDESCMACNFRERHE